MGVKIMESAQRQEGESTRLEAVEKRLQRFELLVADLVEHLRFAYGDTTEVGRVIFVAPEPWFRSHLADLKSIISKAKEPSEVVELAVWPWRHLVWRKHPWRRQLYVKGRNMPVRQLVATIKANTFSPEEAARNFNLAPDAIWEAVKYAEENKELLDYEAEYERHLLTRKGYRFEPPSVPG